MTYWTSRVTWTGVGGRAGHATCGVLLVKGIFFEPFNCLGWIYDITVLTFPLSLWLSLPLYLLTVAD